MIQGYVMFSLNCGTGKHAGGSQQREYSMRKILIIDDYDKLKPPYSANWFYEMRNFILGLVAHGMSMFFFPLQ